MLISLWICPVAQLGFWCPGTVVTMAALNRNYELWKVAIVTEFLFISISNLKFFQHRKSGLYIYIYIRIHFAAYFATPLTWLPWVAPTIAPSYICACLMDRRQDKITALLNQNCMQAEIKRLNSGNLVHSLLSSSLL